MNRRRFVREAVGWSRYSNPSASFAIVLRRCFGLAGNRYATSRSRPSMRIAWPSAEAVEVLSPSGIEAAYKRQLAEYRSHSSYLATRRFMSRIEGARGPVGPLTKFQMEEMIDPAETRGYLARWVELATTLFLNPVIYSHAR